jgi:hypothetical protein
MPAVMGSRLLMRGRAILLEFVVAVFAKLQPAPTHLPQRAHSAQRFGLSRVACSVCLHLNILFTQRLDSIQAFLFCIQLPKSLRVYLPLVLSGSCSQVDLPTCLVYSTRHDVLLPDPRQSRLPPTALDEMASFEASGDQQLLEMERVFDCL